MPSVAEATSTQLNAALVEGLNTLSQNQTVTFTQYTRLILPADGFIFWVKTQNTIDVQGSIHYATDQKQNEDENIGIDHMVFTATQEVNDFNSISPTTIYIGSFSGLRFSFNKAGYFYKQAGIYHYRGDAIYPAMKSQILDSVTGFDQLSPVVSNSLPIFLALNDKCDMYPSFLVDQNIVPPYASIHIDPNQTKAIQSVPLISRNGSHSQLVSDHVKITLYGLRNDECLDFMDYIFESSVNTDNFGIMNMPVMRDEKRTQSELNIIAQKKTFELDVSYYQSRVKNISRQLILSSIPAFLIQ